MRLVDNHIQDGIDFDWPPKTEPSYLQQYGYIKKSPWQAMPLHQAARDWVNRLDIKKLESSLAKSGMPYKQADESMRRLIEIKHHVKKFGKTATKGSVFWSPWADLGKK
jgi:hypothetical protein